MRERIEDFLDRTERVQLLAAPTPLHALSGCSEYKDVQAYIKRDDMTGLGPGGNKVRSLEYILGEAVSIGCKKILAAGPVQSNLCTLTAAACARLGLECELVHNGEEPEKKEGNLLLNGLLGTVSHFLGSCDSSERNAYTEELAASYEKAGIPSYVVRNGATTGRGALGYTAAVREMKRQCEEMQIHNMTIFAPGGNGGVAAGLIYGNEMLGRPFRIVIISVEDDRDTLIRHIEKTIHETEKITGITMEAAVEETAEISDLYRGAGWGMDTRESKEEILRFSRQEGIFIENIYNSKVVVGMKDWIRKGKAKGAVCYLHTGGFGSLFAQY